MVPTYDFLNSQYPGSAAGEPDIVLATPTSAAHYGAKNQSMVPYSPSLMPATSTASYGAESQSMVPYSPRPIAAKTTTSTYKAPPPPDTRRLKNHRQKGKVVAGVVGGTVGLVTLGPLGMVAFGVGGALAVKHGGRARERKIMRKYEARVTQDMAMSSSVPIHAGAYA